MGIQECEENGRMAKFILLQRSGNRHLSKHGWHLRAYEATFNSSVSNECFSDFFYGCFHHDVEEFRETGYETGCIAHEALRLGCERCLAETSMSSIIPF